MISVVSATSRFAFSRDIRHATLMPRYSFSALQPTRRYAAEYGARHTPAPLIVVTRTERDADDAPLLTMSGAGKDDIVDFQHACHGAARVAHMRRAQYARL